MSILLYNRFNIKVRKDLKIIRNKRTKNKLLDFFFLFWIWIRFFSSFSFHSFFHSFQTLSSFSYQIIVISFFNHIKFVNPFLSVILYPSHSAMIIVLRYLYPFTIRTRHNNKMSSSSFSS